MVTRPAISVLKAALLAALTLWAAAGRAAPEGGIAEDRVINQGLFVIAVADEIRDECDTIDARMWRALVFINKLRSKARERGYSRAEIDAYLDDEQAQDLMRARRNAYFARHGAGDRTPESLCALGRAEIARNSQIGYLLKAE